MQVILIAAITLDGFIARTSDEGVTWSKDLKLFKKQTMGYPVIMGSNTAQTLAVELEGREKIIVHRHDVPQHVLSKIQAKKCFVIGGGMTNTKFASYLTHLYLSPHPIIFGKGIRLFSDENINLRLKFIRKIKISKVKGIYQFQYKVLV